jgi:hypothetical protein
LGELNERVVFVGGCAVHFLVPATFEPELRTTEDVDLIVPSIRYFQLQELAEELRGAGFEESAEDGVICRWRVDGITVDIMPTDSRALGFSNRWYDQVFRDRISIAVELDLLCQFASAPSFLATKFEAFAERGGGNYESPDFEDVVMVLAYRGSVSEEIQKADPTVRAFLREQAQKLLGLDRINEFIGNCFTSKAVIQARPRVLKCIKSMAEQPDGD